MGVAVPVASALRGRQPSTWTGTATSRGRAPSGARNRIDQAKRIVLNCNKQTACNCFIQHILEFDISERLLSLLLHMQLAVAGQEVSGDQSLSAQWPPERDNNNNVSSLRCPEYTPAGE